MGFWPVFSLQYVTCERTLADCWRFWGFQFWPPPARPVQRSSDLAFPCWCLRMLSSGYILVCVDLVLQRVSFTSAPSWFSTPSLVVWWPLSLGVLKPVFSLQIVEIIPKVLSVNLVGGRCFLGYVMFHDHWKLFSLRLSLYVGLHISPLLGVVGGGGTHPCMDSMEVKPVPIKLLIEVGASPIEAGICWLGGGWAVGRGGRWGMMGAPCDVLSMVAAWR
ncbi:hypothetical protein SUGI_1036500 [Cryptomeria japonica]|nr:hypothetical protein SUGI_1036500 [Cryptomeria japonica]